MTRATQETHATQETIFPEAEAVRPLVPKLKQLKMAQAAARTAPFEGETHIACRNVPTQALHTSKDVQNIKTLIGPARATMWTLAFVRRPLPLYKFPQSLRKKHAPEVDLLGHSSLQIHT